MWQVARFDENIILKHFKGNYNYIYIYMFFQKAFDKVTYQRLLLKLKAHGIRDGKIDWIEQWLTDRRQRVVVDGEVSNWKSVLSGVPQGSVLGPVLFLIYINDLDDNIISNVLKFAVDTNVLRRVNNDGDKNIYKTIYIMVMTDVV